jgi:AraC-like DNA-binding protein
MIHERTLARNPRIARVVELVLGDLSIRYSLEHVANVARLERSYFSFYFHKAVGLTFTEWDARVRIEEAKRLLADSDVHIGVIAMRVGYGDLTTFGRNFRKRVTCSPSEYRRQRCQAAESAAIQRDADYFQKLADNFQSNAET